MVHTGQDLENSKPVERLGNLFSLFCNVAFKLYPTLYIKVLFFSLGKWLSVNFNIHKNNHHFK